MQVKFKKFSSSAVLPTYAKQGDAGLDLTSASDGEYNPTNDYWEFDTHLAVEIPPGYVGLVFPRSSVTNTPLLLANSVGVIDSSYRGSIKFRFKHIRDQGKTYYKGDRIGQLIIVPIPNIEPVETEELTRTERGQGGYGSTGK